MEFREFLKNNVVVLDGGFGTLLIEKGLKSGERTETWSISHPDTVKEIHKSYYDNGSNVINTNTFGANLLFYSKDELDKIISSSVSLARSAREESNGSQEKFVALDIGPLGKMLAPFGDFDFEEAVNVYKTTVELGVKYGVDLIALETFSDLYELKAAVLAVKETTDLPVIASVAFTENGKLLTGGDAPSTVALLEGLGVDALGINCSLGPKELIPVLESVIDESSIPVSFKPNAGLPIVLDNKTVFSVGKEEFSSYFPELIYKGVRLIGGCCGTTPEYINELIKKINGIPPKDIEKKNFCVVSSYSHAVKFGDKPVLIGERINPTGKKKIKQALIDGDLSVILKEAVGEAEKGVHILDINAGIPDINEDEVLQKLVTEISAVIDLPLEIDTSSYSAMEKALRRYNGKALINSVNGKKECMDKIFPLAKKYGGVVVALTLDENGIPESVEGRVNIAKNILEYAKKFGIEKKDIIFDALTMTVATDKNAPKVTLSSVKKIREELGVNTSLGVSNVSFGLPNRDVINASFFLSALNMGLSGAIINPYSDCVMNAYYSFLLISGRDDNCQNFIDNSVSLSGENLSVKRIDSEVSDLKTAIVKGLKDTAETITKELLKKEEPLKIIDEYIIPALNEVGKGYEEKTVYLPSLLMSAEASKVAFEVIKEKARKTDGKNRGNFVLATVEGDIHDIGKNIVKLLLQNYGFNVIDLGKDVKKETVLKAVIENDAKLLGLSALMTTTVPNMEATIKLVKEKVPSVKIIVGGAVLNYETAERIGADAYAKDAMRTVRLAEEFTENK